MLDFYIFNELRVLNIFTEHKEEHKINRAITEDKTLRMEMVMGKFVNIRTYCG